MFLKFKPKKPKSDSTKKNDNKASADAADSRQSSRVRTNSKNIKRDSSWITAPSKNADTNRETKKTIAIDGMTKAFAKSIRCSLDKVEDQTTVKDRIDSIHFGNLLVALDAMLECMKTFGMKQTTKDLEYHYRIAREFYQVTPPESRDYLARLMQTLEKKPLTTLTRGFSLVGALEQREAPSEGSKGQIDMGDDPARNTVHRSEESIDSAVTAGLPTATITSDTDEVAGETSPERDSPVAMPDHGKAKNSMFWLCYFVRYVYNVHRLVFEFSYDVGDASSMIFMRFLNPHFSDYYNDKGDAKAYLKVLKDYRTENFLGDGDLDLLLRAKLVSFFRVLEAVMYLWTPAFQEKGRTDAEFLSR